MANTLGTLENRLESVHSLEARLEATTDLEARSTASAHISVSDAVDLINSMVFLPEWEWTARDYTGRFEGGIRIDVVYQARNSDRENAPDYTEWTKGGGRASYVILITDCFTPEDVLRKLIDEVIMGIFMHETREFLRYPDTLVAPFHPHRQDTMKAWGTPEIDIKFGAA